MKYDIRDLALKYGVENIKVITKFSPLNRIFIISYTSSSDPQVLFIGAIDESRYDVADGYKITIKPIDNKDSTPAIPNVELAKETFYQSDFNTLWQEGFIEVLVSATAV
jgi:hypothetical protein